MSGTMGRTAVAEMISSTHDAELFSLLGQADRTNIENWVATRIRKPHVDPDMRGKSALDCALYKMSIGQIDPREVETNFGPFLQ